ncbi:hypothetical protein CGL51_06620 [Pyrobaculum aerophilum]|uniref:Uncharacterized protein n=1 Tax=Pyrobaculum aerophilum TaxID=13773 RepID=A0A371R4Y5_9CREN|nr:hypothetical protein CGL51_06620 [Pyrobaculum aerophilum]RFA99124.1 hypothetical protein CGL52_05270 [Pyrobaculum aerophilum]
MSFHRLYYIKDFFADLLPTRITVFQDPEVQHHTPRRLFIDIPAAYQRRQRLQRRQKSKKDCQAAVNSAVAHKRYSSRRKV